MHTVYLKLHIYICFKWLLASLVFGFSKNSKSKLLSCLIFVYTSPLPPPTISHPSILSPHTQLLLLLINPKQILEPKLRSCSLRRSWQTSSHGTLPSSLILAIRFLRFDNLHNPNIWTSVEPLVEIFFPI